MLLGIHTSHARYDPLQRDGQEEGLDFKSPRSDREVSIKRLKQGAVIQLTVITDSEYVSLHHSSPPAVDETRRG